MSKNLLAAHRGVYRGLSPTDESAIAAGEAKIVITGDSLIFTMATGVRIDGFTIPTADLLPMTAEEIVAGFKEGSEAPKSITGFKGNDGYPILLFFRESALKQGFIMWTGGMEDMLGPTMMSGPGLFPRLLMWIAGWILDFKTSGGFPRFLYGGKTRRHA